MWTWKPGDEVGELENWPFTDPRSDYVIEHGAPKASGRLLEGGPGHSMRYGIWRCTAGAVTCTEQGHEMMLILSGRCKLINHTTRGKLTLEPGDCAVTRDGDRVTWDVLDDITKVFFGAKSDGF